MKDHEMQIALQSNSCLRTKRKADIEHRRPLLVSVSLVLLYILSGSVVYFVDMESTLI